MTGTQIHPQTLYSIATAATMTGVSVHTIRAWERRYGAVTPQRTDGGRRQFTIRDVDRLGVLKRLTDLGESISAIASLNDKSLKERLYICVEKKRGQDFADIGPIRLGLFGVAADRLSTRLVQHLGKRSIVTATANVEEFRADIKLGDPNVLLLDYPAVDRHTLEEIRAVAASAPKARCLLIYRFAVAADIRLLEEESVVAIRGPAADADILRAITSPRMPPRQKVSVPEKVLREGTGVDDVMVMRRLFSDQQLSRLAEVSSSVQCECPEHLVDLVRSLSAFEAYSAQCENRNPDDAELHAYLHAQTSRARSLIEEAMAHLIELEGLEV